MNEQKEKYSMSWFYRPLFYWSFTALLLIAGVVFTIMLITSSKVTQWYGYVGPAYLFAGLVQILWYFILKKSKN
jgi:hypothetical protein